MHVLITAIGRILDKIMNFFAFLAICLILFLVVAILYEVAMRYFLGRTQLWTFEVTQYCLLFITFLATAWLLKEESHVKMDLLLTRLKPAQRARLNAATSFIGALMFLVVTYYSSIVVLQTARSGYYLPLACPTALTAHHSKKLALSATEQIIIKPRKKRSTLILSLRTPIISKGASTPVTSIIIAPSAAAVASLKGLGRIITRAMVRINITRQRTTIFPQKRRSRINNATPPVLIFNL